MICGPERLGTLALEYTKQFYFVTHGYELWPLFLEERERERARFISIFNNKDNIWG
jgi:hypothetical protein